MATLAIRGHATRGKEVIEILEMLGGKNGRNYAGKITDYAYIINAQGIIEWNIPRPNSLYTYFTFEEFLKTFPYKVGDKVLLNGIVKTIKQAHWDSIESEVIYKLETNIRGFSEEYWVHYYDLKPYKETMEDEAILNKWTGLKVELELSKSVIGVSNVVDLHGERFMSGFVKAIIPPEGYQLVDEKGNVINATKIVFEKKENEYPSTYEDCCKVLGISYRTQLSYTNPDVERGNTYLTKEKQLLDIFMKLRICCNAYWKIAGEEMGLGKPWEPDWNNISDKYCIYSVGMEIWFKECQTRQCNLAFPTAKIRDTFYENFKSLIEECKELL